MLVKSDFNANHRSFGFNSSNDEPNKEQLQQMKNAAYEFICMPDSQIKDVAQIQTFFEAPPKNYLPLAVAVPALDTVVTGASTKGGLGAKTGAMASTAGDWGTTFIVAHLYNKATNKMNEKIPALQEFQDKHPVAKMFADFLGFSLVLGGTRKAAAFASKKARKSMPEFFTSFDNLKTAAKNTIDKSFAAKKIFKPVSNQVKNFSDKFPRTSGVLKQAGKIAVPLLALGVVCKIVSDVSSRKNRLDDNYEQLKQAQLDTARVLAMSSPQIGLQD